MISEETHLLVIDGEDYIGKYDYGIALQKWNLKIGDIFQICPFDEPNYDYKGKTEKRHKKSLKIIDITRTISDSWNGDIKINTIWDTVVYED